MYPIKIIFNFIYLLFFGSIYRSDSFGYYKYFVKNMKLIECCLLHDNPENYESNLTGGSLLISIFDISRYLAKIKYSSLLYLKK
jgi:hypothetical protein